MYIYFLSKEVWKSNFRQYGEMKKQSAGKRVRREKIRRKKMQVREKVGKSRSTVFFRGFVAPEGWKVGSLKRRVRRHLGRWEMKSCTPFWCEAHFQVKMYKNTPFSDHFWKLRCRKSARRCGAKHISKAKCTKTHHSRTTFGSWDVEKVHAVVARSTFPSQNVQNTPASDHFWKLRCRKSARCCGAKQISKSKCTKHHMFAPLLEVQISKKRTPLWREAHFEVKMYKTLGFRTTFGGSDVASLRFGSLHYTIHSTTLQYITLHYTPQHYNYNYNYRTTQLHSTTLHYIKLQYTTPHYTTLHYTTLHYTTLYTPLHYTTLHYTIHSTHYSTLHYTTLHNTTTTTTELHNYTPLHSATHRYTKLHYTTLHYTRKIDR